jgi:PAS domain S-box-containing protein
MKSITPRISLTGLRARLLVLVLIGLLPVCGLLIYTSLMSPQTSLLFVGAAFGVILALWIGEKIILAPMRRLLHQVNALAGADAASQAGAARNAGEFVELSSAFHRMADLLKAREKERDSTELALRAAQGRLLTAQRIGKIGNWEFDIASNQVWWSDQTCEIYGLTPAASASSVGSYERVLAQVFPPDRERFEAAQKKFFAGKGALDIEHRIVKTNGEVRWVHGLGESIVNAHGAPITLSGTVQDITERTLSEQARRTSEAQFRLLTDAMPQIVWMMQPDGCPTFFNQRWMDYTGLALEESLGHGWSRLIHPDDSLRAARLWEQAASSGDIYEIECRLRRADGVYRWMLGRAHPQGDATGHRTQWLGTFTDIDDLKQAAQTQEKSLSMLRIAGKVAHLGGWSIELPDRTLIWSDENCLIHDVPPGYEPSLKEGIGYFLPEHRATVIGHVEACAQQGIPYDFVLPKLTAKGRRIWVRSIGEAVRDDAGKIIRIQGAFQDITQRHAEQAQLRLLETAVSRLNDIVIIAKAEPSGESGPRIVFVNDAFERYTGYSRHDALGNSPRLLLGPKSQCAELDRIHAAVKKWQPVRAEIVSYTKAGQALWLEIDIAPIADESGRFTHWVSVGRDITERRRQQEEILSLNNDLEERVQLRTAQMQVANKELESFSYSVSHDLRSPLNTINGFSHLLTKIDGNHVSEKGRHYLNRIRAGAQQMGELIEGLLTLAQLSREQIKSERVDLSAIARRIARDCREREPERQAQMHIQDGLSAHGDPRLLSAVFHNLLGNAWKFTSRQVLARIDVGSELGADGDTLFFVRDNGAGFDMAFAHKLFGTFERLHSPEEFPGSGIGLATVKRVIERHGGRVWAESRLNEGATFYFTLGRTIESVT